MFYMMQVTFQRNNSNISTQGPSFVTYPHSKHAWTVREGALVLEELKVHLANVVLQVKGCGEVGLAVVSGTNQHRLMGGMDPFVPPQSVCFLEHLLTCLACECGYITQRTKANQFFFKKRVTFQGFCTMITTYVPGCLAMCF